MTSRLDSHLTWASIHVQAQTLVHRLTAVGLEIELLQETLKSSQQALKKTLESVRGEVSNAAHEAQAIADRAHVPTRERSNLASVLRDTLAPLDRYVERREVRTEVSPIDDAVDVAVEPALLRSAIALVMDLLLRGARAGEVLSIAHAEVEDGHRLSVALHAQKRPPETLAIEQELAPLRAMLEVRRGRLSVVRSERQLQVHVDFMERT